LVGHQSRYPVKYLEDKSLFLFAGIGNFKVFRKQVATLSAQVDCALEFSDHQVYDTKILTRIRQQAAKLNSDVILTTGKDWVKLGDFDFGRETYYLDQNVDLDPGEEKLIRLVEDRLHLKKLQR
jgi:tetraacyldisaccharide 4'-kinase